MARLGPLVAKDAVRADHGDQVRVGEIDTVRQAGESKVSMLQDFEQGRKAEIDAILSAPLELAALANVPMPMTRTVHALARARCR